MQRGFKALAERHSAAARSDLHLPATAPLDPWVFAAHLKVLLLDFASVALNKDAVSQLTVTDSDSWSAMTLKDHDQYAVVLNSAHALTRRRSDLMHELAHIQLGHIPSRVEVSKTGFILLSDFSEEQEQEADWHGAALLVPREGLVQMRAQHVSAEDIADFYGVSEALCAWRLRMTGVDVQMRRSRSR